MSDPDAMTAKQKPAIVVPENPPLPKPPEKQLGSDDTTGKSDAYSNNQLDLFQTFLCNTDLEKEKLSNAINFWDSVPRYSISRKEMNKRRDEKGNLPSLHLSFEYHGQPYIVKIQPARIDDGDKSIEYYPSANEELVEDTLRKLATRHGSGFFEKPSMRSGVAFTLYELREELSARGHARSYQEIIQYLTVLQRSHIEIRTGEGKGESFVASNYLPTLAAVSRKKLREDPNAKWLAQFHPLVSQCIDQLTYRQFNYQTMMELPTQLARWIHKLLSIKFTFASIVGNPFEIHYNTIKRDSNLLNCDREKDNRREVDNAFTRLIESKVLREVQKRTVKGSRGKTLDVVYQLYPSLEFIREMKASNKRKR
ncbi:hypothetical protein ANRL3_02306 [Anaerolineae bacterium]|nr:hypothetical protein ANRL3_02306 [Anaerolineae bacterium]